jgi:hypothetical protein
MSARIRLALVLTLAVVAAGTGAKGPLHSTNTIVAMRGN